MTYSVKEIFYTLQGEGSQAGYPAVFLRFAGCNLWSGLEKDRNTAVCKFCDTNFVGVDGQNGGKFKSPTALAQSVTQLWPTSDSKNRLVVCTGGEPLLQLDHALIDALHEAGFRIAIETNGTIAAPTGIDWICVSPKSDAPLNQTSGHELKLVFPQDDATPDKFEHLKFENFYLQPMDGEAREENTRRAIQFCMEHPLWRLSIQTHKILGID